MTHYLPPSERKENARAALRTYVIPNLNARGREALEQFLANPVLKPGETFEDIALDITAAEHVTRTFKEGEVVAIGPLLEAFAVNEEQYLGVQATSPKARHVQEHIDELDTTLYAGGADYIKLGQLIGSLRTHVSSPDKIDVIQWLRGSAKQLGVDLAPDEQTGQKVEAALANIAKVLSTPTLADKILRDLSQPGLSRADVSL